MFDLPQRAIDIAAQVESFFQQRVLPNNKLWEQQAKSGQPVPDIQQALRAQAKELGLWNMALPRLADDEPGLRLTNLEFTAVAEILGRLEWALMFLTAMPQTCRTWSCCSSSVTTNKNSSG